MRAVTFFFFLSRREEVPVLRDDSTKTGFGRRDRTPRDEPLEALLGAGDR